MIRPLAIFFFSFAFSVSYSLGGFCSEKKIEDKLDIYGKLGYSHAQTNGNPPRYLEDFASLGFGANLDYKINENHMVGLSAQIYFAPFRRNIKIRLKDGLLEGPASLRTNYYSFLLYKKLKKLEESYFFLGPAAGVNNILFKDFSTNDLDIKTKNKLMIESLGLNAGIRRFIFNQRQEKRYFVDFSLFYLKRDAYYITDNLDLDAEKIRKRRSRDDIFHFMASINFGIYIF